jgi:hypothetical protein
VRKRAYDPASIRLRKKMDTRVKPAYDAVLKGESMETVGLVGVGKIGLPISENLIKSGLSTGNKQQRRTT